jgi:hypothetical protein
LKPRLALSLAVGLGLILASVGGTTAGVASQSSPAASRIIDRAYLCTNAVRAGVRQVDVFARSGVRDSDGWKWLAFIEIRNQGPTVTRIPAGATSNVRWGYTIAAGTGPSSTREPLSGWGDPAVSIWSKSPKACVRAPKRRVPLSSAGLSGGEAGQFEEAFECAGVRRVLVRVRAVLAAPTRFRLDRRFLYLRAKAPVEKGWLAARTVSGKPLVFASVNGSGKARIFTDSCFPD